MGNFFKTFLKKDPSKWPKDRSYNEGLKKVKKIKIVNDVSERGVKLMTDLNAIITNKEPQKQCLLQVTTDFREIYPNKNKETLLIYD